jgi:hypothetical protein
VTQNRSLIMLRLGRQGFQFIIFLIKFLTVFAQGASGDLLEIKKTLCQERRKGGPHVEERRVLDLHIRK